MVSGLEIRNQLTFRRIMRELPLLTKKTSLMAGFCHLEGCPLVRLYCFTFGHGMMRLCAKLNYYFTLLLMEQAGQHVNQLVVVLRNRRVIHRHAPALF